MASAMAMVKGEMWTEVNTKESTRMESLMGRAFISGPMLRSMMENGGAVSFTAGA